jgi:hypothetical protein
MDHAGQEKEQELRALKNEPFVIARNEVTKQSNYIKYLQIMRLLHCVRNDVFFDFLRGRQD